MIVKVVLLLLRLLFMPITNSQVPFLGTQPYFRGILSTIPFSNSNGEFLPSLTDNPSIASRPTVTIADGTLRGFTMRTVNGRAISAFQSIPYAQPPVGALRFRDPIKNLPWKGILETVNQAPECIQLDFVRGLKIHGKEDCLYLNVYVPQKFQNTSLPVMIFIHGGSYFYGAGSIYGPRYLLDRNVVLVTFNYRLGPFGFLSTGDQASPGNQGMKDQVFVLKWVQDNIAAFGGDPNSITILGESVGGTSVQLHMLSPLSRGLFHRGISQSGSAMCSWANIPNASQKALKIGETFKCPTHNSEEMVECLRKIPARILTSSQFIFVEWFLFPFVVFGPTVEYNHEGAFMTKSPEQYYEDGEAQNLTWINGLNPDEFGWIVAAMIWARAHIEDINKNWDHVGPIFLGLDYNSTEVNVERVRRIWDFYMGKEKLTFETRRQFSHLFGDRYVMECSLEAMRYHSMYTTQPVYGYHLTYQGRYGNVQQFGGKPEDWGVVHLDDLMYLLNNPDYYASLKPGDPELEMSHLMTSIWSNFATYDIPYIPVALGGNRSRDIWQPIEKATNIFSPLTFLDLNLNPKMIGDPYVNRYNFWKLGVDPNP